MNCSVKLNLTRPIDEVTFPQLIRIVEASVQKGETLEIDASQNDHAEVASIVESIRSGLKRAFAPPEDQQYHWFDPSVLSEVEIENGIRFDIRWHDQNKMVCKFSLILNLL